MNIYMCVNRGDTHQELLENLKKAILKTTQDNTLEVDVQVKDVGLYGEVDVDGPTFIFGTFTKSQVHVADENIPVFYMPDLQRLEKVPGNQKTRLEASKKIIESIKSLSSFSVPKEKPKESYGVEEDSVTLGIGDEVDIEIPEDKVEYLQRIKKLLKAQKVIVKKGDIKIEFT